MYLLWIYLICLAVFLVVDAVWLSLVMKPLFDRHVGELMRENFQFGAAAAFYLIYIAGVVYFCVVPALTASVWLAVLNGAILGFLAYGTYEFTNMTTLKGWQWSMVVTDTAWGMALTAFVALSGALAARAFGWGAAGGGVSP